jgi:hypothetical protein
MVGIQTGVGQAKPLDRSTAYEVLLHNRLGVTGVDEAVPDRFGIDDDHRPMLALVEAARLVNADAVLEASSLDSILELAAKLLAVFMAAAWPGGGLVAFVQADEDVVFKFWHGAPEVVPDPLSAFPAFSASRPFNMRQFLRE